MSAAEKILLTSNTPQGWREICAQHANMWVCLIDVNAHDGAIRTARVLGHDPSMRYLLAQIGDPPAGAIVVHTGGRPRTTPRLEMTDEIRDLIRAGR